MSHKYYKEGDLVKINMQGDFGYEAIGVVIDVIQPVEPWTIVRYTVLMDGRVVPMFAYELDDLDETR